MARIVLREERERAWARKCVVNAEIGDTVVLDYYPRPETEEALPYEVMVTGKKTNEEGKTLYLLADSNIWVVL